MRFDIHNHVSKKIHIRKIPSDKIRELLYEVLESKSETLAKVMLKNNIAKSCIFPFPFPETKTHEANSYIIESYQKYMELFIPFLLIGDEINGDLIKNNNVMGFKEHFALGHYKENSYFNKHYEYLEGNDLFLIIHPHRSERVAKIKYLKKTFPKLKIILAHSGREWPFTGDGVIKDILPALKGFEDVFFDTSTIRNSETIVKMVNMCGSKRILFGSDYPFFNKKGEDIFTKEIETITLANITDEAKNDLLKDNFSRLFLNPNDYQLFRCMKEDKDYLMNLIKNIPKEEKKFLAINIKLDNIKRDITNQQHLFLVKKDNDIVGFARESGRKNNGAVLEEVYIDNSARRNGLAKKIMDLLLNKFSYLEAKTFSNNNSINSLFKSMGGEVVKKSPKGNISYWKIEKKLK